MGAVDIPIVGCRLSGEDAATIAGLLDAGSPVFMCAAQAFAPDNAAGTAKLDYPGVRIITVGLLDDNLAVVARYISVKRLRNCRDDVTAISRLLDIPRHIAIGTAQALAPGQLFHRL